MWRQQGRHGVDALGAGSARSLALNVDYSHQAQASKTVAGHEDLDRPLEQAGDPETVRQAAAELVAEDVVSGSGTGAKAGDQIVVSYVGVLYSTGEQFDASWDAGRPYSFVLGQGA